MRLQYHTRNIQRIEGGLRQPGVLLALRMASVVDAAPGEFFEALFEEAASAYDQAGEPEGRGVNFFDAKNASERMKKTAEKKK